MAGGFFWVVAIVLLIITKAMVNYIERFTFMNTELLFVAIYLGLLFAFWLLMTLIGNGLVKIGKARTIRHNTKQDL